MLQAPRQIYLSLSLVSLKAISYQLLIWPNISWLAGKPSRMFKLRKPQAPAEPKANHQKASGFQDRPQQRLPSLAVPTYQCAS